MYTATEIMLKEKERVREIVTRDKDKLIGQEVTIDMWFENVHLEATAVVKTVNLVDEIEELKKK